MLANDASLFLVIDRVSLADWIGDTESTFATEPGSALNFLVIHAQPVFEISAVWTMWRQDTGILVKVSFGAGGRVF